MDQASLRTALVPACGALGLVIGSFLNVVVHRLPRRMSLVAPASHCPRCGTTLRWFDNVPVVSWLALRAHCRTCRASIPVRYPVVELATAVGFAAVASSTGATAALLPLLVVVATAVAAAMIELDGLPAPPSLVVWSAVAALGLVAAAVADGRPTRLVWASIGAGAAAAAAWCGCAPSRRSPRRWRTLEAAVLGGSAAWLWPVNAGLAAICVVVVLALRVADRRRDRPLVASDYRQDHRRQDRRVDRDRRHLLTAPRRALGPRVVLLGGLALLLAGALATS